MNALLRNRFVWLAVCVLVVALTAQEAGAGHRGAVRGRTVVVSPGDTVRTGGTTVVIVGGSGAISRSRAVRRPVRRRTIHRPPVTTYRRPVRHRVLRAPHRGLRVHPHYPAYRAPAVRLPRTGVSLNVIINIK